MNIAKRQEASLRYFLGSEMQKARIIQRVWDKYNKANHNTSGKTRSAIFPKNDKQWVDSKRTYDIKYTVNKTFGVIDKVFLKVMIDIDEGSETVAFVLNDGFKRRPRVMNPEALYKMRKWAARKISRPQYVVSKGKKYWYPAHERAKSIAYLVAKKIDKEKKIQNKSGFLKPFQRKNGRVNTAMRKAVDRWLVRWNDETAQSVETQVSKTIQITF
tara:strand:+ start:132 stop:776 length:645 start_codon:yes stop_codon:yes gene_type:complete